MTIYRHVRNAEDLHLEVFFHMGGAKCLNSAPLKISKNFQKHLRIGLFLE